MLQQQQQASRGCTRTPNSSTRSSLWAEPAQLPSDLDTPDSNVTRTRWAAPAYVPSDIETPDSTLRRPSRTSPETRDLSHPPPLIYPSPDPHLTTLPLLPLITPSPQQPLPSKLNSLKLSPIPIIFDWTHNYNNTILF